MNKEQTAKFNSLFNDTLTWGDEDEYGTCNGLFEDFGANLEKLSTGIDEECNTLNIYHCSDAYWQDPVMSLPINSSTKRKFKKVVEHLMTKDWDTLPKV